MFQVRWEWLAFERFVEIWAWKRNDSSWVNAVLQAKIAIDKSLQTDPFGLGQVASHDPTLLSIEKPLLLPHSQPPYKLKVFYRVIQQEVIIGNAGLTL